MHSSPIIDLERERAVSAVRAQLVGRAAVDRATILTDRFAAGCLDLPDALQLFAATATPLPETMWEAAYA